MIESISWTIVISAAYSFLGYMKNRARNGEEFDIQKSFPTLVIATILSVAAQAAGLHSDNAALDAGAYVTAGSFIKKLVQSFLSKKKKSR